MEGDALWGEWVRGPDPTSLGSYTCPRAGFLHLGGSGSGGHTILCCGSYLTHCRISSSICGLYPLDAKTAPKCPLGVKGRVRNCPQLTTTVLEYPPGNLEKEIAELHGAQFINNRCSQFLIIHKCGAEAKVGKLTFILPHCKLRREPGL